MLDAQTVWVALGTSWLRAAKANGSIYCLTLSPTEDGWEWVIDRLGSSEIINTGMCNEVTKAMIAADTAIIKHLEQTEKIIRKRAEMRLRGVDK